MATKVNYARWYYYFLGTIVEHGENASESVGEDHRHYMEHSWVALTDQLEKGNLCNDDVCSPLLDEYRRSRRDRQGLDKKLEMRANSTALS